MCVCEDKTTTSSSSSLTSTVAPKYHQQKEEKYQNFVKIGSSNDGNDIDSSNPSQPPKILKSGIQFGKPGSIARVINKI